jgi:hypothetical protein
MPRHRRNGIVIRLNARTNLSQTDSKFVYRRLHILTAAEICHGNRLSNRSQNSLVEFGSVAADCLRHIEYQFFLGFRPKLLEAPFQDGQ